MLNIKEIEAQLNSYREAIIKILEEFAPAEEKANKAMAQLEKEFVIYVTDNIKPYAQEDEPFRAVGPMLIATKLVFATAAEHLMRMPEGALARKLMKEAANAFSEAFDCNDPEHNHSQVTKH